MVRDLVLGTLVNLSISNGDLDFLNDSIHARVVDGSGRLRSSYWLTQTALKRASNATAGTQLYTPVPYNLATRAAMLNTIFNTSTMDQEVDLIEYLTVNEVGSGDDRVVEGLEQVFFVTPSPGRHTRRVRLGMERASRSSFCRA